LLVSLWEAKISTVTPTWARRQTPVLEKMKPPSSRASTSSSLPFQAPHLQRHLSVTSTHGLRGPMTDHLQMMSSTPLTGSVSTLTHTSKTPSPTPSPAASRSSRRLSPTPKESPASLSGSLRPDGPLAERLQTWVSHPLTTPRPTGTRLDAHDSATLTSGGTLSKMLPQPPLTHLSVLLAAL